MRFTLARRAAERLERGEAPSAAASTVIAELASRVAGLGGLIAVTPADPAGGESPIGIAFNTPRMARALRVEGAAPFVAVIP